MKTYRSEHTYKPSPNRCPCYKGFVCKHKAETTGGCRFSCSDYIEYERLVQIRRDAKAKEFRDSDYRSAEESRMLGRYK